MAKREVLPEFFLVLILMLALAAPALARGDKVIPQVADGPGIVTKFDFVNVSDGQVIKNYKLRFFHQDGSAWSIPTTLGTGSEFTINMNPRQKLHIETLGQSNPQTAGYAVIRDDETANSTYSVDFVLGITAYYVTTSGGSVTGIVSVPASNPTVVFSLPVEINSAGNVLTGLAIANLSGAANQVSFNLFASTDPPTGPVGTGLAASITLQSGQQRAEFLNQQIYPGRDTFQGVLEGTAQGPISILGLIQVGTAGGGVQYATISPTLRDSLRQNSSLMIPQAWVTDQLSYYSMDVDAIRVDYLQNTAAVEALPWDLKYVTTGRTTRELQPVNGAGVVKLANMADNVAFDNVSLTNLRTLQYSTSTPLDFSNVVFGDAFAVHTNLGNYAKIRIVRLIDTLDTSTGNHYLDLGLEVYVYK